MRTLQKTMLLAMLVAALLLAGCPATKDDESNGATPFDDAARWAQLHGDGARTDAVLTAGIREQPTVLFSFDDPGPSPFSGPVVGPDHETSLGTGGKIYRVLGPGPVSFNPPPGIEPIIGLTAAIQAIHPRTGQVLAERSLNLGAFTTFAAVDKAGDVYVPDWGRLQKYSGGLVTQLWRYDFGGLLNGFGAVPAGAITLLPDGNILLPFLSGHLVVLDVNSGQELFVEDLSQMTPPIALDPQFGFAGVLLRNAVAIDGDQLFVLVNGELLRYAYDIDRKVLRRIERSDSLGFSSSTPTLDIQGKRMFLVTFDPNAPDQPPLLRCFDYALVPMSLRWSVPTRIDFLGSEDQLTVTFLPESGVIINNSLYGHLTAYIEKRDGQEVFGQELWSTSETIGPEVAAYIASATEPQGTIYFVENFTRTLYALDAMDGRVLWSHEIPAQSIKTPIPHKGVLFVDHAYGMVALTAP